MLPYTTSQLEHLKALQDRKVRESKNRDPALQSLENKVHNFLMIFEFY